MKKAQGAKKAARPPINTPLRQIMSSSAVMILAAVLLSLVVSAILVVAFDKNVQESATYLLAKPGDFFNYAGWTFGSFFTSLFRGAIFDYQATSLTGMLLPITNSLTRSVPLILAGLSVALAFRAGLFNIGAQGQLLIGATLGVWSGLNLSLPYGVHLLVAVVLAVLGGAVWGAVPGILKARVGANEVIVTIMMNSIALFLLSYFLKTRSFIGHGYPGKSLTIPDTAAYPKLLGSGFDLHFGFLIALLAAVFVWWLLERSTFGFELRAAGANPSAARTAGISVNRVVALTMVISGALAGLAGTAPALGTERFLSAGTAGTIGFDAITVALLGASTPLGTVLAGILFGAFAAGASTMQAAAGIPVDVVSVSQAIIVLLIAAPPLIRWIFRLPTPIDSRIIAKNPEENMAQRDSSVQSKQPVVSGETPEATDGNETGKTRSENHSATGTEHDTGKGKS